MTWDEFQNEAKSRFSIDLPQSTIDKLALYEETLLDTNKELNLTAHRTSDTNRGKNFLDSLAVTLAFGHIANLPSHLPSSILHPTSILDLGTGAGFPGMVLAIVFPEIHVTLMDSIAKKATFLKTVQDKLALQNVQIITAHAVSYESSVVQSVVHKRATETIYKTSYGQSAAKNHRLYDLVVSRAVAPLTRLLPIMRAYCKPHGTLIAMKGANLPEEIRAYEASIRPLGPYNIRPYSLPSDTTPRSLFVMRYE